MTLLTICYVSLPPLSLFLFGASLHLTSDSLWYFILLAFFHPFIPCPTFFFPARGCILLQNSCIHMAFSFRTIQTASHILHLNFISIPTFTPRGARMEKLQSFMLLKSFCHCPLPQMARGYRNIGCRLQQFLHTFLPTIVVFTYACGVMWHHYIL